MLEGDDWFALPGPTNMTWPEILRVVETEQEPLAAAFAGVARGRVKSPVPDSERLELALGVACHAVHHAGQIQFLKRLPEQ